MYIADLHEFLRKLAREGFYGVVEIRYESGHVSVVKKTESLKVEGDEPFRFREQPELTKANLHKNEVNSDK